MIAPKHQNFIQKLAAGASPKEAYLELINPNSSAASACTLGIRLKQRYQTIIDGLRTGEKKLDALIMEYEEAPPALPKKLNHKHQTFIDMVAHGVSLTTAYKTVIGEKASDDTCRTGGSRLAKRYGSEIAEAMQKRIQLLQQAHEEAMRNRPAANVLTETDIKERLTKLIESNMTTMPEPQDKDAYNVLLRTMNLYVKLLGPGKKEKFDWSQVVTRVYVAGGDKFWVDRDGNKRSCGEFDGAEKKILGRADEYLDDNTGNADNLKLSQNNG